MLEYQNKYSCTSTSIVILFCDCIRFVKEDEQIKYLVTNFARTKFRNVATNFHAQSGCGEWVKSIIRIERFITNKSTIATKRYCIQKMIVSVFMLFDKVAAKILAFILLATNYARTKKSKSCVSHNSKKNLVLQEF